MPETPYGAIFHAKCGNYWTGTMTCHCGSCCKNFSGLKAFDRHRRGSKCLDPETIPELVPVAKPHWMGWGHSGQGEEWWKDEV